MRVHGDRARGRPRRRGRGRTTRARRSSSRLPRPRPTTAVGDSVAIDGVCLTAEAVDGDDDPLPRRRRDARADDARRGWRRATAVNVEPALRAGEPLGGHLVQGHVDGVGTIASVEAGGGGAARRRSRRPTTILRYCVEKGSITRRRRLAHGRGARTRTPSRSRSSRTRSPRRRSASSHPGGAVNLEVDVLAKYVERLLEPALTRRATMAA